MIPISSPLSIAKPFPTEAPEAVEQEMRMRLTHLYISSGIDFENPADLVGYNQLLITFLDARTTAWMLGYFQGDDVRHSVRGSLRCLKMCRLEQAAVRASVAA